MEIERANDNDTPFQDDENILPIVGLGGSAGSISVLQDFFEQVRPDLGIAYVVVHLSPDYESALAQVLGARTSMPVIQVMDRVEVRPNCVYVIPPSHHLSMQDGHLHLSEPRQELGKRVAVDLFFRTLAVTHRSKAMAVVLSGMDGDGAIGIKRVKEAGGVTVAQEPTEAEHEGMPRSAIETGMVDWILPVRDIAFKVAEWIHNEERLHLPSPVDPPALPEEADEAALRETLAFLQARTGHDFQHYKRATILRRIGRRLQVNSLEGLPQYVNFLRTHPGEAGALLQDLLISVTNFFRDPESFLALDMLLPRLFRNRAPGDTIRVWVAGCATGEEAYSLAMLLDEYTATLDAAPEVQIFATDLDEQALRFAREGVYPVSIAADVSPERLRRYFVFDHGRYRVKKEVRERVLFAPHNVLQDAPFSRIDLVSCRNLLIYFNRQAQERVFQVFHFALKPSGLLFLGGSESADDNSLFVLQDRAHRIYEKQTVSRAPLALPNLLAPTLLRPVEVVRSIYLSPPTTPILKPNTPTLSYSELHLKLLEQAAPPSVLVDANYDIVHLSEHAGQFLRVTGGEMSANLLTMVAPALRVELRVALFRAVQSGEEINVPPLSVEVQGGTRRIRLRVRPMREDERQSDLSNFILVIFEDAITDAQQEDSASLAVVASDQSEVVRSLEAELEHLRGYLRSSIEQYETSAEELKASNEELQALNEEQRSAAEELETSREEIQAGNEELTTVNSELKAKIEELGRANSDLQNLMSSTDIATVFLNRSLNIKRYTPPSVELFHFIPTDTGRPLADLKHDFKDEHFIEEAAQVLQTLAPINREIGTHDGHCFLLRISPYRTIEDYIDGVVLTFVDITERRKAEEDLREREAELARVQRIGGIGGVHIDVKAGLTGSRSPEYRRLHGLSLDVTHETHEEWLARVHPEDRELADSTLHEALAGTGDRYESEYRIIRPIDGEERWISARLTIERDNSGHPVRLVGAHIDITEREQGEIALRESEEKYRMLFNSMDEAYAVVEVMADEQGKWNDFLFLDANPAFMEHTTMPYPVGKTATQLLGTPSPRWAQVYGQVAETGESVRIEDAEPTLGRVFDLNIFRLGGPGSRRVAVLFTNITSRKEAENERERLLRETQLARADADLERRRLLAVLEQLPVGVHIAEAPSGRLVFDNAAVRAICGEAPFSPTSSDYSRDYSGHYPGGHSRAGEALASEEWPLSRALATGEPATEELVEIRRADGTRRMASISAVPIRDTAGRVEGAVATSVDVTEIKRAEEGLRASEARLQKAIAIETVGVVFFRLDGHVSNANEAAVRMFGYERDELLGITERKVLTDPEFLGMTAHTAEELVARGETAPYEKRMVRKDGSIWWGLFVPTKLSGDGRESECVEFVIDITEAKRAEEAVQKSEARLHAIANLVPDLLWSNDPTGYTDWYNEQWLNYTGQTLAEATNYGWLDAIHPDDRDNSARNFQRAVDRGEPLRQEQRIRGSDGRYRWFLVQAQSLKDQNNQIIRWFGSATDIQDLKEAQQSVLESEERLRIAIEAGELATWDWDVERDEIHWNERHFLLFGMTPREGVTHERDFSSHLHPDDYNSVISRLGNAVENSGFFDAEFRIIREDNGEVRWMNGYGCTTESRDGRATRMTGVMFDSTERRQAQEILQRAHEDLEKRVEERTHELKEALEQVRAEIEHRRELESARTGLMRRIVNTQEEERGRISRELHDNLGQHLTAVMLGLQALEDQISSITGGKRTRDVPQLGNLRELVDGLMRAAHDQARQLRPAELDAMGLEAALGQYIRDWTTRADIEVDFQAFGWQERPDIEIETTFYRVIQEALTNVARHAGATRVSVVIEHTQDMATAVIEDNGHGFDTEQATNRLGVLGMKERLDLIGGTLEIESIPGEGTAVFARIPLHTDEPEAT